MRKLSKTESVFMAVVRETNEEIRNESTITINEDKTKTPYPVEVQAILDEFIDVFPKDLLGGLPPSRELDHRIELVPRAEPPHKAPYRISPQGLDELKKQLIDLTEKTIHSHQCHHSGRLSFLSPKRTEESACVWIIGRQIGLLYIIGTPCPVLMSYWIGFRVPDCSRRST